MKNSEVINQYTNVNGNLGNNEFLDAFKVGPRLALEKEVVAARAILLRNRASTSLAVHGFISSIQPCVLGSTKPLPTSSAAPFANFHKHGFAFYLALEEIEQSEYYTGVEIRYPRYQVIHKSNIKLSNNFIKNLDKQKSEVINQYIDAKVNVGNKEFLDAFKVRPRVALEKEAAAASAMLLRNRAFTSLAKHGFISFIQPCVLACTKPLSISSAASFAKCRKHGFASYLAIEEIEQSEYYTRVEIRYPRYQVIHNLVGMKS
ncbi:hypothetical protein FXO38_30370 [Capsicum annuum]|nr:hypothetical protein FXO38_30370 [Capsicum annuum]KAF3679876.1 hypothetical protein FXO37_03617 [Capsicum annuum]